MSILALGSLLNGLLVLPYVLQLAHGWTGLGARVNLVAVVILVPTLLLVVPKYGAVGAAWLWLVLNFGYFTISLHFMFRRILPEHKLRWYLSDVGQPLMAAVAVALILRPFFPADGGVVLRLAGLGVVSAVVLCGAAVSATIVREQIVAFVFGGCVPGSTSLRAGHTASSSYRNRGRTNASPKVKRKSVLKALARNWLLAFRSIRANSRSSALVAAVSSRNGADSGDMAGRQAHISSELRPCLTDRGPSHAVRPALLLPGRVDGAPPRGGKPTSCTLMSARASAIASGLPRPTSRCSSSTTGRCKRSYRDFAYDRLATSRDLPFADGLRALTYPHCTSSSMLGSGAMVIRLIRQVG